MRDPAIDAVAFALELGWEVEVRPTPWPDTMLLPGRRASTPIPLVPPPPAVEREDGLPEMLRSDTRTGPPAPFGHGGPGMHVMLFRFPVLDHASTVEIGCESPIGWEGRAGICRLYRGVPGGGLTTVPAGNASLQGDGYHERFDAAYHAPAAIPLTLAVVRPAFVPPYAVLPIRVTIERRRER